MLTRTAQVHAFYVISQAQDSFKAIASQTGGRCEFLDVNSPSGADMLTDFFSASVLECAGGERGGELVAAYNKMFGKGYTVSWQ